MILIITTDDGSAGQKGFVTDPLKKLLESGNMPGMVLAIVRL
jgi:ferredoxin--NADP+ reductase